MSISKSGNGICFADTYEDEGMVTPVHHVCLLNDMHTHDHECCCGFKWTQDREPQPTDGPDYHANHQAWKERNRGGPIA